MTPTAIMSLGWSLHRPILNVLRSCLKDGSDIIFIAASVSRAIEILHFPTWQGKAMMLVLVKAVMADCKLNSTVCFSTLFLSSS